MPCVLLSNRILQQLGAIDHAPSVQMQYVPPDFFSTEDFEEPNPDERLSQKDLDKHVQKGGEFYDDDRDQDTSKPANPVVDNENTVSAMEDRGE